LGLQKFAAEVLYFATTFGAPGKAWERRMESYLKPFVRLWEKITFPKEGIRDMS
jgi:hypothetical protein